MLGLGLLLRGLTTKAGSAGVLVNLLLTESGNFLLTESGAFIDYGE